MSHRTSVRSALAKLDYRVVKLDSGTNWILDGLNRPASRLSINELCRRISMLPEMVIQSMFVHGAVDNTSPEEIDTWTGWIRQLRPQRIQIYSLDRMPAKSWVRALTRGELENIARRVEDKTGIPTDVF